MKQLSAVVLAVILVACQPTLQGDVDAGSPSPLRSGGTAGEQNGNERSLRDLAFAEAACAGCHAIRPRELSPNPEAPPFTDIANRPGLTAETLSAFLRDAHNYPEVMDFDLDGSKVDALTAYILTLRDPLYRRPSY